MGTIKDIKLPAGMQKLLDKYAEEKAQAEKERRERAEKEDLDYWIGSDPYLPYCRHEGVDIGFRHHKWVCKLCDKDLIEGKDSFTISVYTPKEIEDETKEGE